MAKTEKMRELLRLAVAIRENLAQQLRELSEDNDRSDDYKIRRRGILIQQAEEQLRELADKVEESMPDFKELDAMIGRFDYDDPRLMNAVSLIEKTGKDLPEAAWRSMLSDYAKRPAVLAYLSDWMYKHGATEAAIVVKEAAQNASYQATMPRRIEDAVYYLLNDHPESRVDVSRIYADMDELDRLADSLSEPAPATV